MLMNRCAHMSLIRKFLSTFVYFSQKFEAEVWISHFWTIYAMPNQELRSWFESNAQFPSTTPAAAAHITNSTGLLSQSYLDPSDPAVYIHTVAWHCDRVYFQSYLELSWSTKYKVANSQWSGRRNDQLSTLAQILLCSWRCISYQNLFATPLGPNVPEKTCFWICSRSPNKTLLIYYLAN